MCIFLCHQFPVRFFPTSRLTTSDHWSNQLFHYARLLCADPPGVTRTADFYGRCIRAIFYITHRLLKHIIIAAAAITSSPFVVCYFFFAFIVLLSSLFGYLQITLSRMQSKQLNTILLNTLEHCTKSAFAIFRSTRLSRLSHHWSAIDRLIEHRAFLFLIFVLFVSLSYLQGKELPELLWFSILSCLLLAQPSPRPPEHISDLRGLSRGGRCVERRSVSQGRGKGVLWLVKSRW